MQTLSPCGRGWLAAGKPGEGGRAAQFGELNPIRLTFARHLLLQGEKHRSRRSRLITGRFSPLMLLHSLDELFQRDGSLRRKVPPLMPVSAGQRYFSRTGYLGVPCLALGAGRLEGADDEPTSLGPIWAFRAARSSSTSCLSRSAVSSRSAALRLSSGSVTIPARLTHP